MRKILQHSNIAIVGGGRICKAILEIILGENFRGRKLNILGIADINETAEGLVYARDKGIFTTLNYKDLFKIKTLDKKKFISIITTKLIKLVEILFRG